MGSKSNDSVLVTAKQRKFGQANRGEGDVKKEAETGVMQPQPRIASSLQNLEKARNRLSPGFLEGVRF